MARSLKVAVIGAGVAGLVTGRELNREGHQVVIYEKADRLGGTWLYNPRVDSDPLSLDPSPESVHGSLYSSLRTNFPRHLMGFSDYQFTPRENEDSRIFPGHKEVLKFLNNFSSDFGLRELIRFNTEVVRVERVDLRNDEWVIESRTDGLASEEVFEAVVVCNGHYTEPQVANLQGIQKWPGKQVHSHNYRVPEPFRNQTVVTIGDGPSAHDISREIARVAKEVHLSSRSPHVKVSKLDGHANMWQHSKINHVDESGLVNFEDGSSIHANIIFYCTGYKYNFPFLKTNGIVTTEDNRVGPLYKHVFPPQLGPSLSFVGIPYRGIIFRCMELQAKWISQALSGKVTLPSQEKMLKDIKQYYQHMEEFGIPKHHTHRLHPYEFEYLDWLAAEVGVPPLEKRLKQIYEQLFKIIASPKLENFREWDVDQWIQTSL